MKKIGIRADGDSYIGMGHIMRCISISKELIKRSVEPIFIVKDNEKVVEILKLHGIQYKTIKNYCLKYESKVVINLIKELNLDGIIIDSYCISNEYLRDIYDSNIFLISIDDNNLYNYPSDLILNPNIYANDIKYRLINPNTKLLLGCNYIILREEFIQDTPIIIKDNIENILVTMGGSDINNYTPIVLRSLSKINKLINVIVGPQFKNYEELINLSVNIKNINLIKNPKNIKDIMKKNDIAISASGATTYELAVLGIPTILVCQCDNQENIGKKAGELEMMINLGMYNFVKEYDLYNSLLYLINNPRKREDMSEKCKKNIGKNGVINIVNEILNY